MEVALLASAPVSPDSLVPDPPPGTRIVVVAWSPSTSDALVALRPRGGVWEKISRFASRTVIGRVLLRLTPLDPGVQFWTASRKDGQARAAISRADLLVAIDRDTAYAAWRWMRARRRKGASVSAVFGYPAGRALIAKGGAE